MHLLKLFIDTYEINTKKSEHGALNRQYYYIHVLKILINKFKIILIET